MYCEKCGNQLEENEKVCSKCGYEIESVDNKIENVLLQNIKQKSNKHIKYYVIAVIILIMFIVAGFNVASHGKEISKIISVGGKTLQEAYYHELGGIYFGYSVALYAVGVSLSTFIFYLGYRVREENK